MLLLVSVTTPQAGGLFNVPCETLSEGFSKIPEIAASKGLALINDGVQNDYRVCVLRD